MSPANSAVFKKALGLVLLITASMSLCWTQTIGRQLFGSGGNNSVLMNPTYYVSWSMGEPVVYTLDQSLPILTQGFQQPETLSPLQAGSIQLRGKRVGQDIVLEWEDHAEGAFDYRVECWQAGSGWKEEGITTAPLYRHYGVIGEEEPGERKYRIRAFGRNGSVRLSNTVAFQNEQTANITLFPNPVHDRLFLSGLHPGMLIQLLDSQGKGVLSHSSTQSKEVLQVSNLAPGIYVVRIQGADTFWSQKLSLH